MKGRLKCTSVLPEMSVLEEGSYYSITITILLLL